MSITNAYVRLLIAEGRWTPPASSARQAPQDNWVHCRCCGVEATHVRDLVHEPDCWGQRVWQDGRWHWPGER